MTADTAVVTKGAAITAADRDLRLDGVSKVFGAERALVNVSATFRPGEVAAVLGPNGAGKSTLIGIVSTLVAPSSGRVRLEGHPLDRGSPLRRVLGYVGHEPGVYGDLTAEQNLELFAALYGLGDPRARAEQMLARVGLAEVRPGATARTFSRGMQQRLALGRALLHEPRVLLFDEPAAALDPAGAAWIEAEIARERDAGRIVVLVTHDLDAAAGAATHVVVLRRGRVVRDEIAVGGFSASALRALYREATGGAA